MLMPQTIRRYCDAEMFDLIARGERSFDLRVDDHDVQVGDYYLFVERLPDGQHGRQIQRLVSYVVRTKDLQDDPHNLTAVSFVSTDFMTLEALLADGIVVVAYAVEKFGSEIKIVEDPACVPLLSTEGVNPYQLNDFLKAESWPDGQYSITLRCRVSEVAADGTQELNIIEKLIMVRTRVDEVEKIVCVDHRFLIDGRLRDFYGNVVEAEFGDLTNDRPTDGVDPATLDRIMAAAETE
jgi:hypothetical protein